jgi:hypothetical protein
MSRKQDDLEKYSSEEAAKRFKVTLLGARIAGHKPMESLTRGKAKKQRKPKKKSKASA